jgi:hypothetical protein
MAYGAYRARAASGWLAEGDGVHRVTVAEQGEAGLRVDDTIDLDEGGEITIGKAAQLLIAVAPPDAHVSRTALAVRAVDAGWDVTASNRNGIVVHPWALPAWKAQRHELLTHDRVALRVLGDAARRHWVLLERDGARVLTRGAEGTVHTAMASPARPLTVPQHEVMHALFAELLAWPPKVPSEPRQLKQVAREMGISVSGVQARLQEVRAKAQTLGLSRQVTLTDPEYMYVLVRAGYLTPTE